MNIKFFTDNNITIPDEDRDKILAALEAEAVASKKAIGESQSHIASLKTQLTELESQKQALQKTIDEAPNVDEALKASTKELEKVHAKALKDLQEKSFAEIQLLKRDSETVEFFKGLNKKFVTPETELIFRQRLNEALQKPEYEGKNRAEIFGDLILSNEGQPRVDLFETGAIGGGTGAAGGSQPMQPHAPTTPQTEIANQQPLII